MLAIELQQAIDKSKEDVLAPLLLSPPSPAQSQAVVVSYLQTQAELYKASISVLRNLKTIDVDKVTRIYGQAWEALDNVVALLNERKKLKEIINPVHEVRIDIIEKTKKIVSLLEASGSKKKPNHENGDQNDPWAQMLSPSEGHSEIYFDKVQAQTRYNVSPIDDFRLNMDAQLIKLKRESKEQLKRSKTDTKCLHAGSMKRGISETNLKNKIQGGRATPVLHSVSREGSAINEDLFKTMEHHSFDNSSVIKLQKTSSTPNHKRESSVNRIRQNLINTEEQFEIRRADNISMPAKCVMVSLLYLLEKRAKRHFFKAAKVPYKKLILKLKSELDLEKKKNEKLLAYISKNRKHEMATDVSKELFEKITFGNIGMRFKTERTDCKSITGSLSLSKKNSFKEDSEEKILLMETAGISSDRLLQLSSPRFSPRSIKEESPRGLKTIKAFNDAPKRMSATNISSTFLNSEEKSCSKAGILKSFAGLKGLSKKLKKNREPGFLRAIFQQKAPLEAKCITQEANRLVVPSQRENVRNTIQYYKSLAQSINTNGHKMPALKQNVFRSSDMRTCGRSSSKEILQFKQSVGSFETKTAKKSQKKPTRIAWKASPATSKEKSSRKASVSKH